eukprot:Nk52_evm53s217 gene=Nk52_evmTU53s217
MPNSAANEAANGRSVDQGNSDNISLRPRGGSITLNPMAPSFVPDTSIRAEESNPTATSRTNRGNKGNWGNKSKGRNHSKNIGVSDRSQEQNRNANSNNRRNNRGKERNRNNDKVRQKGPILKEASLENLEERATSLSEQLKKGEYECMICYELIGKRANIWFCEGCFAIFHFTCIRQWAAAATESFWRCPGCQNEYKKKPRIVNCFCGKSQDKSTFQYDVPHTCGEQCERPRDKTSAGCVHKCREKCHPGPCPPCDTIVRVKCHCGATQASVKCGQREQVMACKKVCGKALDCGVHHCEMMCHPGDCEPCHAVLEASCYCGATKNSSFKCGDMKVDKITNGRFSCKKTCNKLLSCGNHRCEDTCHEGHCKPCSTDPSVVKNCFCGSRTLKSILGYERKSCLDIIVGCGSICGNPLVCNERLELTSMHFCEKKCHEGPCPSCEKSGKQRCVCGLSTRIVNCKEVAIGEQNNYLCGKICKAMKTCGKHRCNSKCCISRNDKTDVAGVHVCQLSCGKMLQCGKHKCQELCHLGYCPPCLESDFSELACHCGATVMYPPIPCGSRPPVCDEKCAREHECNHEVMHNCHQESTCPPCPVLCEKMCMGGHQKRPNVPCYLKNVSCGNACQKPLPCGVHKCPKSCHRGPCLELTVAEQAREKGCGGVCGKKRDACDHHCPAQCHPDHDCPDEPCRAKTALTCRCGRRRVNTQCGMSLSVAEMEYGRATEELMAGGENVSLGEISLKLKDFKPCRFVECDKECTRLERNRRLAEALKIDNTDARVCMDANSYYSNELMLYAKNNAQFVKTVDFILRDFAVGQESSKTKKTLPVMSKEQRKFVKTYAKHFEIDTYSVDPEPVRSVVLIRTEFTTVPTLPLMDVVENGLKLPHLEQRLSGMKSGDGERANSLYFSNLDITVLPGDIKAFVRKFLQLEGKAVENVLNFRWDGGKNAIVMFEDSQISVVQVYESIRASPYSDIFSIDLCHVELNAAGSKIVEIKRIKTARPSAGTNSSSANRDGKRVGTSKYSLNAAQPNETSAKNSFSALLE